MIDGKTHAEILAMPYKQRSRWYQTLDFVDRGIAMEVVETARRAKISKNNSMKRPEVRDKHKESMNRSDVKAKIGAAWTSERRGAMSGENNPNYGKTRSDESRAKISGENNPNFGKSPSEETRAKMRGENNPMYGKTHTPEVRAKIGAANTGENNPRFNNWSSREPYCHLWTDEKREEIRNRDERRCQSCGRPEILNGQRLSVHHIDGDKMQGCGKRWGLVALCRSCNSRPDTLEKEFLIVSNLNA